MNQKKTAKSSDEAYSNYQEVGGDANDKSQSSKQLPLWLREGLEKIKQEKQKKETEKKEPKMAPEGESTQKVQVAVGAAAQKAVWPQVVPLNSAQ